MARGRGDHTTGQPALPDDRATTEAQEPASTCSSSSPATLSVEEALRASEERFRATFEQAAVGLAHVDLDGHWLRVNGALCEIVGYTREELLALTFQDVTYPADLDTDLALTRRLIAGEIATYTLEKRYIRKDRSLVWINLTVSLVRDARGAPEYFISVVENIMPRKRAEEAAHASEERLHAAMAHAPVVLFAVDRDGIFTVSEGDGLHLMGLQPGQHVGQSYFTLYGHLTDSVTAMRRALAGEEATTVNAINDLVFETRWRPTWDTDGTVSGVIGVSADITERTRLERRAQESLDALLAMAQTIVEQPGDTRPDDGSTAVAVGQRLADLTRGVLGCQRVGITAVDRVTGLQRPVAVAGLSPDHARRWWAEQQDAPLADGPNPALAARLLAGEALVVDMRQPPFRELPNPYGIQTVLVAPMRVGERIVGILSLDYGGTAHTFTPDEIALAQGVAQLAALALDRDRLMREQAEAHATELALRETTRRMDEFLGVASHELRSPLTSVKGAGQLAQHRLQRIAGDERVATTDLAEKLDALVGLLQRSDGQIGRVVRLVDDLLDVSRIETHHLELRLAAADMRSVVGEAVEEQQQVWITRTITVEIPDALVPVRADADRLAQVVMNYLTNALKYSAEDQPVAVSVAAEGAMAWVRVRDAGPGLTPEQQEHVWDRYERISGVPVRDDTHAAGGGLGLGLYISRTIVESHGGRVGVESTPGSGSTFWLTIPLAAAED